jgi:D-arabinose 1-dehydrogenase-like Zn-dependent alcohol dehydrogenase
MEETLKFSKLHEVNCLVEKFPLERANEAFGTFLSSSARN